MEKEFWSRPEVVDRFAEREPDHRLRALVGEYADPGAFSVLDLGCAGGRNTVLLAGLGFDVRATDASPAMVARTRERLAPLLGEDEAARRVLVGRMDDLTGFADGSQDLVVSLGVYHQAETVDEWERALAETARVLKPGGRLLASQFTPEVDLPGEGVRPVPDEPGVFEGMPNGRAVLVDAAGLDAALARHGLVPEVPSETVRAAADGGVRVSVNALYRKM